MFLIGNWGFVILELYMQIEAMELFRRSSRVEWCIYIVCGMPELGKSTRTKLAGGGEFLRAITADSGLVWAFWRLERTQGGQERWSAPPGHLWLPETPPPAKPGAAAAKIAVCPLDFWRWWNCGTELFNFANQPLPQVSKPCSLNPEVLKLLKLNYFNFFYFENHLFIFKNSFKL